MDVTAQLSGKYNHADLLNKDRREKSGKKMRRKERKW